MSNTPAKRFDATAFKQLLNEARAELSVMIEFDVLLAKRKRERFRALCNAGMTDDQPARTLTREYVESTAPRRARQSCPECTWEQGPFQGRSTNCPICNAPIEPAERTANG